MKIKKQIIIEFVIDTSPRRANDLQDTIAEAIQPTVDELFIRLTGQSNYEIKGGEENENR